MAVGTPGMDCERETEGASDPATFGGLDDTYNAGKMQYVQIRYSGYVLSADKELQSLTPEGVGSGTTLDHFMTFNSSDDGIEFFGGVVNLKNYVAVGAEDDNLDVDTGARVQVQYAIVAQRPGVGDTMMEIDSNGNEGRCSAGQSQGFELHLHSAQDRQFRRCFDDVPRQLGYDAVQWRTRQPGQSLHDHARCFGSSSRTGDNRLQVGRDAMRHTEICRLRQFRRGHVGGRFRHWRRQQQRQFRESR